ncbi:MAG: mannose-1-phosphate guanylyltransferase/mannose-6-phosphate isomerase [Pseudomonadales bacterium]|jgi:mannose-1-phosphate guanylyltransferase/mannose-6-phosphate isomerase
MLYPVYLSGGVGSRLWPVSRESYPKQFLPLADENKSLLQETFARLDGVEAAAPIVVCNEGHRFIVAEQLREAGIIGASVVLEPIGKNTAPAVAIAAIQALKGDPNAVLLVLPADHVIEDTESFRACVTSGMGLAEKGALVTFGIVPTAAETGFGYIRRGEIEGEGFKVAEFVEKPDAETAQSYLDDGGYLWNSGMFMLPAKKYLDELKKYAVDIFDASNDAYQKAVLDLDFIRLDAKAFAQCRSESIDYAVMEKTADAVVVPMSAGWSDVGAWSALWEIGDTDAEGNVTRGDVELAATKNSYVRSESRLVATVGVEDLVVVETADAVLVADRHSVQNVKEIVNRLKNANRSEAHTHVKVYRPWGSYESLVNAGRFQVKRIIVNPDARLSLQMHHHRAEHWVVVQGTGLVECNGNEILLAEDQSTYIPLGHKHRLTNPGVVPLEIIEVQTGSYLGEDDIVRFEDIYGRGK